MASRVSQLPVEVIVQPTTQKARVSQLPVEILVQPTTQKARLSQLCIEVLIAPPVAASGGITRIQNMFHGLRNNV
jgi:hypothetical protein